MLRSEIQFAIRFWMCAIKLYKNEEERQQHVRLFIDSLVGEPGEWQKILDFAGGIRPETSWWHQDFALIISEIKNVLGLNGDAILQAFVDYNKIVSSERVCVMPALFESNY